MKDMTMAEKIELALIVAVSIGIWLSAPRLPASVPSGYLMLAASVLLLFQGLVRDLWLMARRKHTKPVNPPRQATCMCVESTVGVIGVVAGLFVLGIGSDLVVTITPATGAIIAFAVMALGFAVKDSVIEWRPFRVRRDKDHINIVFKWK